MQNIIKSKSTLFLVGVQEETQAMHVVGTTISA